MCGGGGTEATAINRIKGCVERRKSTSWRWLMSVVEISDEWAMKEARAKIADVELGRVRLLPEALHDAKCAPGEAALGLAGA